MANRGRPKKTEETQIESVTEESEEIVEKPLEKGDNIEKVVEKKVVVCLLSEEDSDFLSGPVDDLLKNLYNESNSVSIRTLLQKLRRLNSHLVLDSKNARDNKK